MKTVQTAEQIKVTVLLPSQLLERARNIVFWTPGLTLSALLRSGLQQEISTIERKLSRPLPHRTQKLRVGRPISGSNGTKRMR